MGRTSGSTPQSGYAPLLPCILFIMMEKLAQGGYRVGVHAHPLSLYQPLRTKLYAPAERADTLPLFLTYPYIYPVQHTTF
jgi:hypothetical protein